MTNVQIDDVELVETVEVDTEETTEQTLKRLEILITSDDYEIEHKDRLEALRQHKQLSDKLNNAWSLEEVKAFLEMNIEPAKTSNGIYVNDVNRSDKKAGGWSDEEVVAWALGEIKATGKASDGALAQSLISRFKLSVKGNSPEEAIKAYLFKYGEMKPETATEVIKVQNEEVVTETAVSIKSVGLTDMNKQYIESTINNYVEQLKPGKSVSREAGVQLQKTLDNVIKYIINLEDPAGFKTGMDFLMDTIKKHRVNGVFNDTYALRFTDGLNVSGNTQESHNRLLTLFFIFADQDKAFRKQADINYLIQYVNPDKQSLLLQYFEQYK